MSKPTGLGVLAILIFSFLLLIPSVLIFYNNLHKKLGIYYLFLLYLSKIIFVIMLINSYKKCEKCTNKDNNNFYKLNKTIEKGETIDIINDINIKNIYNEDYAVYNLFNKGGWKNFKIWLASLSQNVWKDLLFTLIIFLIPFPILPESPLSRFNIMLSKLGLYKLTLIFILGNPIYIVHNNEQYQESNKEEKIEEIISIIVMIIFILLICYEFLIKKKIVNVK